MISAIRPLRIALVEPPLVGHIHRGTGVYTRNLVDELQKIPNITVSMVKYPDPLDMFDLVHYPYFDPYFLTLHLFKHKPSVVTVHDLIPLKFPRHFPAGIRGKGKWYIQRLAVGSASAIITDSEASKKDIIRFTGIFSEKIHTVYLGVGGLFRPMSNRRDAERTKKKFGLPNRFLLYVGDINYNKNIPALLEAYAMVKDKFPDTHVVLIGKGFTEESPLLARIKEFIRLRKLDSTVHRLSDLSEAELVHMYNLATLYVQPSLAEGFGLPVLEAMSCGCPVVASDVSSVGEIAGDAALLADPESPEEIAHSIERLLLDRDLCKSLKEKGIIHAAKFTWKKTAEQTVEVYKSVSG